MNEPEKRPEDSLVNNDETSVEPASTDSPNTEMNKAPVEEAPASNPTPVSEPAAESPVTEPVTEEVSKKKRPLWMFVAAFVIVAVTLLAVLFILEKEGRSSTGLFDSYFESQAAAAVVAVVNGQEIIGEDLNTSMDQFTQAAFAQGIDVSNPEIKDEIRQQSLDVLVNTELLRQEAEERGISAEVEAAEERIAAIEQDLGGPEALAARIEELGMSQESLVEDIREEILIQQLLDQVFAEADTVVTDEEIEAIYEEAGGEEAGIPPLEDVRAQIEAQISATKEQQAIDAFLTELRGEASVETF